MREIDSEELFFRVTGWGSMIGFIIMMCIICSCGPEAKLRRAKKLIAQAEAEGVKWESDTVYREVKVIVPEIKLDTVIDVVNWHDTITVVKDRVTTRVVVTPSTKTVYIQSKCDSVIVEKRVPYTVTREIRVGDRWIKKAGFILFGLVIGFCAAWVLKNFRIIP
jgi:hypothetical protein